MEDHYDGEDHNDEQYHDNKYPHKDHLDRDDGDHPDDPGAIQVKITKDKSNQKILKSVLPHVYRSAAIKVPQSI